MTGYSYGTWALVAIDSRFIPKLGRCQAAVPADHGSETPLAATHPQRP